MELLKQIFLLVFILIFTTGCSGQPRSDISGNQNKNSRDNRPPEISENLKRQGVLAKQIYSLQREIRDLKIQEFVNEVNQICEKSAENNDIKFQLEQKSGDLIEYEVNGNKIKLPCIEARLLRIHRNFGEMSYGFNNAFRMRPKSQFVISSSANKN